MDLLIDLVINLLSFDKKKNLSCHVRKLVLLYFEKVKCQFGKSRQPLEFPNKMELTRICKYGIRIVYVCKNVSNKAITCYSKNNLIG